MNKKWLLSLFLAVFVSVIAACGNGDESEGENSEGSDTQEEETDGESEGTSEDGEAASEDGGSTETPEPDLEGTPDVVAEVNGEEITKDEFETSYEGQFQQAAMQSQMTGQELDQDQLKQQVAESLISTELLTQEANNRDIEASQEEIDNTVSDLVEQNNLESKDAFLSTLEEQQGMSEEDVMSQVELQVKMEKLISEEAGDIEPTEEELQEAYDQVTAQQEQMSGEDGEEVEIPSFEEMKPDLKEQVKTQKESEASQTLVEDLREDADITNNL
ncbi:peptidyl-prolyl cis-trans isomerase SurA [Salibacterium salarium]|uniref:SurA N-terminal domain-containing protein n=1 Tax=Salibacterium salarium TaxID=284579 RepID=UPI002781E8D0|nr:SurA N-terminal domain-containing protein [Salibacterium salarium]MDQ0298442.1 peptidyl-prolyl cis-trans isomerase SurA [Salibacterium salarium]